MFFQKAKDKLKGKPDGSYVYRDASGKETSGWMPPELLSQILREYGSQKLTRVFIREPDDTIREDLWPIDDETAKKLADHDGTVYVMSHLEDGNPKYSFIAKPVWDNLDDMLSVMMDPSLSDAQKHIRMQALMKSSDRETADRQTKTNDEEHSRQYVRQVFAVGRETCPTIAEALRTTTQRDVAFPVNDDASLEISLAILGTSLAVLKGHSQVMTADRGAKVEAFCKRSIEEAYALPADTAGKLNGALDEYQDSFQKSMSNKNNPFGDISGIMLCRCFGPRATELRLPGTGSLNPLIHQVVGDLMTMIITQTMTFWKGK